jgi:proteasome accessory factor C
MSRTTAADRATRILSIVPWVAERDGPSIAEICDRFAMTRADLVADLDVVFMVGTPPYTPDTLIDVAIEDERVWIRLGDYFRRPLRLVPGEALSLLTAGRAWMQTSGADEDGALGRALDKLAASLGAPAEESMTIELGHTVEGVLETVRRGVEEHRRIEIDYYSYGKDERTTRLVDGWQLFAREGSWYLLGWCHLAEGERMFRLDRIEAARLTDVTFEPPPPSHDDATFSPGPDAPRVTLALSAAASWVVDQFPHDRATVAADGSAEVTLPVTALPWLSRLLLRLGSEAEVVSVENASEEVADAIRSARREEARQVLARYRSGAAEEPR